MNMRYFALLALALAGCSENPLDPDTKNCIIGPDNVQYCPDGLEGAAGGGGTEDATCQDVCQKLDQCCGVTDFALCQQQCEAGVTQEQRNAVKAASCADVVAEVCPG